MGIEQNGEIMYYHNNKKFLFKKYYDNSNTIGTDIKLNFEIYAALTIDINTNKIQVAQGMYRLRDLGNKHSFSYILSYKFVNNINKINMKEIISQLKKTQENYKKENE